MMYIIYYLLPSSRCATVVLEVQPRYRPLCTGLCEPLQGLASGLVKRTSTRLELNIGVTPVIRAVTGHTDVVYLS